MIVKLRRPEGFLRNHKGFHVSPVEPRQGNALLTA